jgi:hypothetical protein
MRAWLGFAVVLIFWQGCGRSDLDDPIDLPGVVGAGGGVGGSVGSAGSGGHGGSGGIGASGGTTGGAGAGAGGIGGIGGTTAHAGAGGSGGVGGSGGTIGHAGAGGSGGVGGSGGTLGHAGAGGVGGIGGVGGRAGAGGFGGSAPACVPGRSEVCGCVDGTEGAQVCQADGTFAPCMCGPTDFERLRKLMIGTWVGQETNPWTVPFQVRIVFGADGHYTAHCAQASCPSPVFYYGVDDDSPLKTYSLVDLRADGTGYGHIVILFGPNSTQMGDLDEVSLSADGERLQMQFWPTWLGRVGPLVFDLKRAL